MKSLTRPRILLLTSFGLLIVPLMLYAFYRFTLPFFNLFAYSVLIYVATPIIIFLVVTFYLDRKFKTELKRYSILALVLFISCLLIFPIVKTLIIKDTENKAQKLVEAIQSYKIKNGIWPQSLDDPHFDKYSKTAVVQRPFYYRLDTVDNGDTSFVFHFFSFDGLEASLRLNSTELIAKPIIWNYLD